MSLLGLLKKRRSVRRYQQKEVPSRVQARLKEVCLRAPSSRDLKPWTFHFVENKQILSLLSELKPKGAEFLAKAPLAVVISATEKDCDTWIEDCSIAAILLQMAVVDAGLGSCWTQVHKRRRHDGSSSEEYVRQVLTLPLDHRILCIIAIGYPVHKPKPIATEALLWDQIWNVPSENSVKPPLKKKKLEKFEVIE